MAIYMSEIAIYTSEMAIYTSVITIYTSEMAHASLIGSDDIFSKGWKLMFTDYRDVSKEVIFVQYFSGIQIVIK